MQTGQERSTGLDWKRSQLDDNRPETYAEGLDEEASVGMRSEPVTVKNCYRMRWPVVILVTEDVYCTRKEDCHFQAAEIARDAFERLRRVLS
jgi:hypothetical protein